MPSAVQTMEIAVPRASMYALITDFNNYASFLDDIKAAKIVRREGETYDVAFTAKVIRDIDYTLRLVGKPPESLTWHLIAGTLFKTSDGSWKLEALGPELTRATYSIDVKVSAFVPSAISNRLIQFTLPTMLAQWKKHAEALHKAQGGRT